MGAALRYPDVERRHFDPDEILSFTQMPDPIWTDSAVSDLAVRVHGFLVCWMRLHPGRFPRAREVASALGRAECTVRRAIQSLERAGYLVLGKRPAHSRYQAAMGYRLKAPGPKLASQPRPDQQRRLFPDGADERAPGPPESIPGARESAPGSALPINKEEIDKTDNIAGTRAEVRLSVLSPPEEPKSQEPTDADYLASLVDRARDLVDGATPEKVVKAVEVFGLENVDRAIEVAEERSPAPDHWRFIEVTLENWKREEKLSESSAASTCGQNYNPVTVIAPLTVADVATDEELPAMIVQAYERSPAGKLARAFMRNWVAKGLVPAEKIPSELLAPEPGKTPAGGHSRQTSPPDRLEVHPKRRSIVS